ncbi:MAG: sulfite exporter TauE/SafE family protein [Proteobacteria bacterium]|nr:MAG: sulfite exporter TauE/SafE family protein [Pseudomonadota bacterium]
MLDSYSMVTELNWLFVLVFFSNAVEAIAGFGATILALTFGASLFPIEELVPILVPLNLLLSLIIVARNRNDVEYTLLWKKMLPFAGIGLPVGLILFQVITGPTLKIVFAVFVILLSTRELIRRFVLKREDAAHFSPAIEKALLTGSGILQGLYASGGPLAVYYASRMIKNKSRFRASLSFFWLILNSVTTATLIYTAKISSYTFLYSLRLLPFVLAGLVAGNYLHHRIPENKFRVLVYALLFFAGSSLLYRSIASSI